MAFTIVGVTPAPFTGLDRFLRPSIFIPLGMEQRLAGEAIGSAGGPRPPRPDPEGPFRPGVSLAAARAELAVIGSALEREYPKTNRNRHAAVRTELQRRSEQSPQLLRLARMLMGLVALILVIACSNVANLLLARGPRAAGKSRSGFRSEPDAAAWCGN